MDKVSAMIGRMKPTLWRGGIPLLLLLLSACSSVVSTRVNTFRAPEDLAARGTISVQAMHADLNRSLEFAWYRTQVEGALTDLGFQVVGTDNADLVALLDYAVEPVDSDRSGPLITTGWGMGRSRYFGTNVVIVDDQRRQEFIRHVQLVIERNQAEGTRVYEVSGASQGRCGVLSVVFDEMLTAMLQGFPGDNASVKTISVKGDARC
ncbi:MAG: hypothetical protein NVV73_09895 [Cellvibrionaceae bacterium]|nr:hypothetical protein [Cellvibrionaceae bacterium]